MPLLQAGSTTTLVQNTVYAVPSIGGHIRAMAALEESIDGTTWVGNAATTTGVYVTAPFVRCTSGATVVFLTKV